jgi:hypothetical protein
MPTTLADSHARRLERRSDRGVKLFGHHENVGGTDRLASADDVGRYETTWAEAAS